MAVAVVEEVILEPLVVVRKVVQQQMDPLVEVAVVVQDHQQEVLVEYQHHYHKVVDLLDLLDRQVVYLDKQVVVQVDLKQQQVETVVLLIILQLKQMTVLQRVEQHHQAQVVTMVLLL